MINTLRNNGLKEKIVFIASQRSGKCIPSELAQTFLAEEARVYMADMNKHILDIVEDEVEHYVGVKPSSFALDFSDPREIRQCIENIKKEERRIDVLVTNFGLLEFVSNLKPFHLQTKQEWDKQFQSIIHYNFLWTHSILPLMMENNFGRIIYICSEAARIGTPSMSTYAAANAAIGGFVKSLSKETAKYNITVNCVFLGLQNIENRDTHSIPAKEKLEKILRQIPLRRFGEPEEISFMVAFLASDLGSYITGQNISVSGGMYMS